MTASRRPAGPLVVWNAASVSASSTEIVAHKGDHIVCRAGIEQFQRQRQIGREGAAAPRVERVAVAGDETDLGLDVAAEIGIELPPLSPAQKAEIAWVSSTRTTRARPICRSCASLPGWRAMSRFFHLAAGS